MTGKIGNEVSHAWTDIEGGSGSAPWGGVFHVEWLTLYDLPFNQTLHIRNPINNNKPVKISRDGQELPTDIGAELSKMLDEGAATEARKRKTTGTEEESPQKKFKVEPEIKSVTQIEEKEQTAEKLRKSSHISPVRHVSPIRTLSPVRHSSRPSHSSDYSRGRSSHSEYDYYYGRSSRHIRSPPRERERSPRGGHPQHSLSHGSSRHFRRSPSPPPPPRRGDSLDLLNMTYEDYLSALNDKYRGWAQFNPMLSSSEMDYLSYMQWVQQQRIEFSKGRDRRM